MSKLQNKNQQAIVDQLLDHYLDRGLTNKQEIYTKIVEQTGLPRPTVRRCAREFRNNLMAKVRILQSEVPKTEKWY